MFTLPLYECESVHSLVSVARLLLTEGWDHLEGNVDKRIGTQSWEVIENCVVPVLMEIKNKDGTKLFTKVFGLENYNLILDCNTGAYPPCRWHT